MEHLPIPRDPIHPHRQVALASTQFADDGPFLTYPDRHAALLTGSYPNVPTQADALAGRFSAAVASPDILDFCQGWLFFSLLKELLGPQIWHWQKYISIVTDTGVGNEGDKRSYFLSTKHLHEDLAVLRAEGPLSKIQRNDDYHRHLEACLDAAWNAFDNVEAQFPGVTKVYADQFLCFAGLAEALDSAVTTAVEQGPIKEMAQPRGFPSAGRRNWLRKVHRLIDLDGPELRNEMLEGGWCPGDISRVAETFNTIGGYYYLSKFKPGPSSHRDLHKACPFYGCTLSSPAEPRHREPDCTCPGMMAFDEESLVKIYETGCIPCFTIGRMENGDLGIALSAISLDPEEQKKAENRYVALSHVWSEGMGNPSANALPFCQLAYVQYWAMLSQQLVEKEEAADQNPYSTGITVLKKEDKTETVNIWIDTMCCPSTPGYGKNLCLARMRDIYANAHAVLVQSAALEEMDLTPYLNEPQHGIMDIAVQLYLSPWMRRMWTLQEAVLAGMSKTQKRIGERLMLKFSHGLLSLEAITVLLKQAPAHESSLAFDMIGKFGNLTPFQYGFDDSWHADSKDNSFLWTLSSALKYRSVSVASDELICLATLLGLRVNSSKGAVALVGNGQTPDEGMCQLWRQIERQNKGIPGDIIFSSVPRINVDGFRWAPRTFIQHAKYGTVYYASTSPNEAPTEITDRGLKVRFSGVQLQSLGGSAPYGSCLLTPPTGASEPDHQVFMVQIPAQGDWYSVQMHRLGEAEEPREGVMPSRLALVRGGSTALLLKDTEFPSKGIFVELAKDAPVSGDNSSPLPVRTICPVTVSPMAPGTSFISSLLHQHLANLRNVAKEAGEEDEVLQKSALKAALEKLASSSKELHTALLLEALNRNVSASKEQVLELFLRVANLFAKHGGVGGTWMATEQSWLVD